MEWPVNSQHHRHMKMRQQQNRVSCLKSPAENEVSKALKKSSRKWTRQAQWGFRLFDFWCSELGVAIEVDGAGHDKVKDAESDKRMFERSGIIVFRLKNFDPVEPVLKKIEKLESWIKRRENMGLLTKAQKAHLLRVSIEPRS
jgi:very-short-patch-repair endonuclease